MVSPHAATLRRTGEWTPDETLICEVVVVEEEEVLEDVADEAIP